MNVNPRFGITSEEGLPTLPNGWEYQLSDNDYLMAWNTQGYHYTSWYVYLDDNGNPFLAPVPDKATNKGKAE